MSWNVVRNVFVIVLVLSSVVIRELCVNFSSCEVSVFVEMVRKEWIIGCE